MISGDIPFKFDLSEALDRLRAAAQNHIGDITLNLPFVSFSVSASAKEKQMAQELYIRLKDRRVLSATECCDNCIDQALSSLSEIRTLLVDKQVELADCQEAPLYALIDVMRDGIRQFLTFEQRLKWADGLPPRSAISDFRRPEDVTQAYFDGLGILRGHLARCLEQIAAIADMTFPETGVLANYRGAWQLEAYEPLPENYKKLTAPKV